MSSKVKKSGNPAPVQISSEVVRQIRQHARSNSKTEVCGVLIGDDTGEITSIEACIAGVNASQGGAHVTFTQDTWGHIYKIKDRDYPDQRIVGWYHSHPGFGVFLSDHDTFIHKNFFSSPKQVAWVYDPHSDEEACFGWTGKRIERLADFTTIDTKGGEGAGETGKPEPTVFEVEKADEALRDKFAEEEDPDDPSRLIRMLVTITSYITAFLAGAALVWFLFPRAVPLVVDPRTGTVWDPRTGAIVGFAEDRSGNRVGQMQSADPDAAKKPDQGVQKDSGNAKGSDGHRQ